MTSGAPAKAKAKPARKRVPKKAAAPGGQPSSSETSCDEVHVTGSQTVKKVVKSRRKFKNELTTRLIAAARAALAAPETGQATAQSASSALTTVLLLLTIYKVHLYCWLLLMRRLLLLFGLLLLGKMIEPRKLDLHCLWSLLLLNLRFALAACHFVASGAPVDPSCA